MFVPRANSIADIIPPLCLPFWARCPEGAYKVAAVEKSNRLKLRKGAKRRLKFNKPVDKLGFLWLNYYKDKSRSAGEKI